MARRAQPTCLKGSGRRECTAKRALLQASLCGLSFSLRASDALGAPRVPLPCIALHAHTPRTYTHKHTSTLAHTHIYMCKSVRTRSRCVRVAAAHPPFCSETVCRSGVTHCALLRTTVCALACSASHRHIAAVMGESHCRQATHGRFGSIARYPLPLAVFSIRRSPATSAWQQPCRRERAFIFTTSDLPPRLLTV